LAQLKLIEEQISEKIN
jgi:hypothetical protein